MQFQTCDVLFFLLNTKEDSLKNVEGPKTVTLLTHCIDKKPTNTFFCVRMKLVNDDTISILGCTVALRFSDNFAKIFRFNQLKPKLGLIYLFFFTGKHQK